MGILSWHCIVWLMQCLYYIYNSYMTGGWFVISEKVLVDKKLLNIKEFCDYLGIGQTKARELLRGRNGFGVQIGNRWYANKVKLDAWIDRQSM